MRLAERLSKRVFYGWVVTALCLAAITTAFGMLYSFGIFFKAWLVEWDISRAMLSAVFSLEFLTYGLFSLAMGFLADRFGLRLTMALGGAVMGAGCVLSSFVTDPDVIFLTWGVMVGVGVGSSYSPSAAAVSHWFVKHRGLAMGLVVSGLGLGTLVFPPICERLVVWLGWRDAAFSLGVAVWVIYGITTWLIRQDPAELGLKPLGQDEPPAQQATKVAAARGAPQASQPPSCDLREALGTRNFWLIFIFHALWVLGMTMPMAHLVPYATDLGVTPATAAAMLAVLGGMSVVGRVVLTGITERMGTKLSFTVYLACQALTMAWLAVCRGEWQLWLFAVTYGITYGGLAVVFPLASAELFGLKAMGSIFGLLVLGATLGGTVGPVLAGHIFDVTSSYMWAFMTGAISMAVAAVMPLGIKARR